MKRTSLLGQTRVETFGLSDELHNIAVDMVKNDIDVYGNYSLEEVDADMLDCWIENAQNDGDEEYEQFLSEAQLLDAEVYAFTDHLGDFSQTIGDVVVY
jgi:hypothetical protein